MLLERKKSSRLKKAESRYAIVEARTESDMSLILKWLLLKKSIKGMGEITQSGNTYRVKVKVSPRFNKSKIRDLVKDRFGIFGSVR
jgi:hypothetical protein